MCPDGYVYKAFEFQYQLLYDTRIKPFQKLKNCKECLCVLNGSCKVCKADFNVIYPWRSCLELLLVLIKTDLLGSMNYGLKYKNNLHRFG